MSASREDESSQDPDPCDVELPTVFEIGDSSLPTLLMGLRARGIPYEVRAIKVLAKLPGTNKRIFDPIFSRAHFVHEMAQTLWFPRSRVHEAVQVVAEQWYVRPGIPEEYDEVCPSCGHELQREQKCPSCRLVLWDPWGKSLQDDLVYRFVIEHDGFAD